MEDNLASRGVKHISVVCLRRADVGSGLTAEGDQVVDIDDHLAAMIAMRDEGKIGANWPERRGSGAPRSGAARWDRLRAERIQPRRSSVRGRAPPLPRPGHCVDALLPVGRRRKWHVERARVTDLPPVAAIAARIGATPTQVGLAWLLQHAANTLLISGTAILVHLEELGRRVGETRRYGDGAARQAGCSDHHGGRLG